MQHLEGSCTPALYIRRTVNQESAKVSFRNGPGINILGFASQDGVVNWKIYVMAKRLENSVCTDYNHLTYSDQSIISTALPEEPI